MAPIDLLQILLSGKAPDKVRSAVARGLAPLPPKDALTALVFLANDTDKDIGTAARNTLSGFGESDLLLQLQTPDCDPSVLEYFGNTSESETVLHAIIANPSTEGSFIETLSLTLPPELLVLVLDNRVRILDHPGILKNIKMNPLATQDMKRLVREIETEFLGDKKSEYSIDQDENPEKDAETEDEMFESDIPEIAFEVPIEDLSLDGIPLDEKSRDAVMSDKVLSLSFREKIRYALFGNRQVRSMLIRDTNREVSKMVLRSPKITEAEIESIASMRSVGEDILRAIGNSKEFTKSYNVIYNLVKNPKTPPVISQRLVFRLRSNHLTLLSRDRSIPEIVRFHASRTLTQRSRKGSN